MFSKQERQKKTRFANCMELTRLTKQLEVLQERTKQMESSASSKGTTSVDYQKYRILDDFLNKIDSLINEYNKGQTYPSKKQELYAVRKLLLAILNETLQLNAKQMEIILTPRNTQRKMINSLVSYTSLGIGVTTGALFLGPWGGAGGFLCGDFFSSMVKSQTGLHNNTPKSASIFVTFVDQLIQTLKGINTYLNDNINQTVQFIKATTISWETEQITDENVNKDIMYLYRDKQNDLVHCVYRGENSTVYRTILNDCLHDNEKNMLSINEQKNKKSSVDAAIIVSIFRHLYTPLINQLNQIIEFKPKEEEKILSLTF